MPNAGMWNDASFVIRSPNRKSIFAALNEPKTPTQLSKELKLDRGYVSAMLIALTKRNLAECLTPNEVRHRLFKRTKRGDAVLQVVNKLG